MVSDCFIELTDVFPMPNMEYKTVNKSWKRNRRKLVIHSNQGWQFENELFGDMCGLLQMERTRTSPYHPKSDGIVERFNRSLPTMFQMHANKDNQRLGCTKSIMSSWHTGR